MKCPITPKIILCGDGDEDIISIAIELSGRFILTLVKQAADLIWLLGESNYSLILLKIPSSPAEMFVVLERIKKEWPEISVILLNGEPEQETLIEAFQAGVCEYFPSPLKHRQIIIERVHAILKQKTLLNHE